MTIRAKSQPEDRRTFNTRSRLGGSLLGPKQYAEAEALLLNGYVGMEQRAEKSPAMHTSCLPKAVNRLVARYAALDHPTDLAKWRAERAKDPPPKERGPPAK